MGKCVRWTQWNNGCIGHGTMPVKSISSEMVKFGCHAKQVLDETGADHVLYGIVEYEDDEPSSVKFYMLPMSEEEYESKVVGLRKCIVYALHRIK